MSTRCVAPVQELVPADWNQPNWYAIWTALVFGQKWQGLPPLLFAQAPGYLLAAVFWGVLNPALLVSGRHRHLLCWLVDFPRFIPCSHGFSVRPRGAMGVAIAFSATEIIFSSIAILDVWQQLWPAVSYRKIFPGIIIGLRVLWHFFGFVRAIVFGPQSVSAAAYLIFWYARNRKTLISARKAFVLPAWR